jgi:hypothetical protein
VDEHCLRYNDNELLFQFPELPGFIDYPAWIGRECRTSFTRQRATGPRVIRPFQMTTTKTAIEWE